MLFNCDSSGFCVGQEVELRALGSRPRTQKNRGHGQGQLFRGQECSRPRTQTANVLQKKKEVFKQIFQAISKNDLTKIFSGDLQNFNDSKNSVVLELKTGQFSRTWGFKTKAKDLTFETTAKAKDFKMCPRGRPSGQECPRRLHLWCRTHRQSKELSVNGLGIIT